MAGLLLIQEFKNWTGTEAVDAYLFNTDESGKVTIQAKPGGNCMQNPSDPDATYVLKIAGWNVLRSAASSKVRAWVGEKMAAVRRGGCLACLGRWWAFAGLMGCELPHWLERSRFGHLAAPPAAA